MPCAVPRESSTDANSISANVSFVRIRKLRIHFKRKECHPRKARQEN